MDSADAATLDRTPRPNLLLASRYELVRKVGEGGMGSVWLAYDQALDAHCAVKLVNDELVANKEVRARFSREARLAAQLRSPHVVHVFDCGESNGTLYIVMEWLEGESLAARIDREGKLDPVSTYRIIAHVARALTSTHALGIVHRDLKPDNVFLVPGYDEETAKVLDFGIAHDSVYSLRDRATREGTLLGTPCYLSPEQSRGKPVDHRADLWSLGVMAFECLTGHSPFAADAIGEVMGRILYEPLPKATAYNAGLPPAVDTWWKRAASRDREGRFQSAKELADDLGKALGLEHSVTVPPAVRARISSFPDLRASGIYSPAAREHLAAQLAGRGAAPEDITLTAPQGPGKERHASLAEAQPALRVAEAEPAPANDDEELASLSDSSMRDASESFPPAETDRFPKWLFVTLPILVLLGGLVGFLWPPRKTPESSVPTAERTAAAPVVPTPDPVRVDPAPTEAMPIIPLENLPKEPIEQTGHAPKGGPRSAVIKPANQPPPVPAPSTRDYGI